MCLMFEIKETSERIAIRAHEPMEDRESVHPSAEGLPFGFKTITTVPAAVHRGTFNFHKVYDQLEQRKEHHNIRIAVDTTRTFMVGDNNTIRGIDPTIMEVGKRHLDIASNPIVIGIQIHSSPYDLLNTFGFVAPDTVRVKNFSPGLSCPERSTRSRDLGIRKGHGQTLYES